MNAQPEIKVPGHQPETTRQVVRWFIREFLGVVMMAVILFVAAGRTDWVMGWAMVVITGLWIVATALVVIPRNPELLAERMAPRKGTKTWDMAILSVYGVITIARYVVAGLDHRFHWTTGISPAVQFVALIIAALGYALVVWATGTNAYFAQTVRIQKERGHTVVTGGPYRFVRHPGYVGVILFELAAPIVLGSWWALILSGLSIPLFIARTLLEDRVLQNELDGYKEYAQQVRYRLIPGLW